MELKDIEDENQRGDRGKTPDRLDAGQQQRRGSHLLAAAGIGYENRRRLSQQNAEAQGRVFQRGNEILSSGWFFVPEEMKQYNPFSVFVQDKDGNMTKLEVVEVREKMGVLRKAVPILPTPIALIFCLLNAVLPGSGTFLGALSLLCCGKCRHETTSKGIKYGMIAALLQISTAIFIFGWIYSIMYGVNMVQDAMLKREPNFNASTEENKDEEKGSNESNCKNDLEANKPPTTTQAWT